MGSLSRLWLALFLVSALAVTAACDGEEDDEAPTTGEEEPEVGAEEEPATPEATPPTPSPTPEDVRDPDELVVAVAELPDHLDPHRRTGAGSWLAVDQVYDTLVDLDEALLPEPALATDWEVADDEEAWTFTLREDAALHDGGVLEAADVVASLRRVLREEVGATEAHRLDAVTSVEARDERTVELELDEPVPDLASRLAHPGLAIVPAAALSADALEEMPVGTGPFRFVEASGRAVMLEAFGDGWREPPETPRLRVEAFGEDRALQAVEDDRADWTAEVHPADAERAAEDGGIDLDRLAGTDHVYLTLNVGAEPFDDPAARRAVAAAVDRDAVVEAARMGAATPAQGPVPEGVFFHVEAPSPERDVDAAREAVDGIEGVDEGPLRLIVAEDEPELLRAARILERDLADVGLELTVQAEALQRWMERNAEGDWELRLHRRTGEVEPYAHLRDELHAQGRGNVVGFADEQVDAALDEAAGLADPEARRERYALAVERAVEAAVVLYLYHEDVLAASRPEVGGAEVGRDGVVDLRPAVVRR